MLPPQKLVLTKFCFKLHLFEIAKLTYIRKILKVYLQKNCLTLTVLAFFANAVKQRKKTLHNLSAKGQPNKTRLTICLAAPGAVLIIRPCSGVPPG